MTNIYLDALEAVNQAHGVIHDTPKGVADLTYAERLLVWNRAQPNPPIRIGMEYVVAKQAVIAGSGNLNNG